MTRPYELWLVRAKRHGLGPLWIAMATAILAPAGYWLNGEGLKGLKYTVIIVFAGYATLGLGTFIGAALMTYDAYRKAAAYEQRFGSEKQELEYTDRGGLIKGAMTLFLLAFLWSMLLVARLIYG
ncbi:MAG: hypothetical protein D6733_04445 [Methanobacteriota archaeon]|nr:MAG: hypothetical protein D6733_04445 [Euryarchaeota archaeon]